SVRIVWATGRRWARPWPTPLGDSKQSRAPSSNQRRKSTAMFGLTLIWRIQSGWSFDHPRDWRAPRLPTPPPARRAKDRAYAAVVGNAQTFASALCAQPPRRCDDVKVCEDGAEGGDGRGE